MSQSPGRTLIPSVEITSVPAGTGSVPTVPTFVMRSPSMRMTLLRMGGPPNPSMSVPPTSATAFALSRAADCTGVWEKATPAWRSSAAASTRGRMGSIMSGEAGLREV